MAWRPSRFTAFVASLTVAHFALHVALGFGREAPDLLVVATLLAARRLNAAGAVIFGFALGLLEDTLGIQGFGVRAFALAAAAFAGARSRLLIEGSGVGFLLVYLFLGAWSVDLLVWFLRADTVVPELLLQSAVSAAWAAVAGVLCWSIYRRAAGVHA